MGEASSSRQSSLNTGDTLVRLFVGGGRGRSADSMTVFLVGRGSARQTGPNCILNWAQTQWHAVTCGEKIGL